MKTMIMTLLTFVSLISVAASAADSQIKCELSVSQHKASGEFVSEKRSGWSVVPMGERMRIELDGFTLTASIRKICAMDGGPCSKAMDLTTVISHGEVSAMGSAHTPFFRHASILTIGRQSAMALCDFNDR
jgi:hypothetical protein